MVIALEVGRNCLVSRNWVSLDITNQIQNGSSGKLRLFLSNGVLFDHAFHGCNVSTGSDSGEN